MDYAKELLDLEYPTGLRFSPDGQSVVYSAKPRWKSSREEVSSIWVGHTQSPKSTRRFTDGLYNDHSPRYSPDGKWIAFLSDRGNGNRGKSCNIYMCRSDNNSQGKEWPTPLTTRLDAKSISKFEFSPDGKFLAFISCPAKEEEDDDVVVDVWDQDWEYARLHLIDFDRDSRRVLTANDAHVVDFSWSEDSRQIAFVTHRSPDIESAWLHGATICTVEVATEVGMVCCGPREEVSDLSSEVATEIGLEVCQVPREVSDLTWVGSKMYLIGYSTLADENSSRSVYCVNLQDGDKSLTKVAHGVDDCAAGLRKVGGDVLVHVQSGMEDQLRLLNSTILYKEKKAILSFDARVLTDGKIGLAFAQGSANRPPEVFAIPPGRQDAVQLSNHGKTWTEDNSTCTFIECQTLDGTEKLEGMFLCPANATAGQALPTIVLIHGGPYWRVTDSFNFLDQFFMPRLLHEGFAILVPNYRGSSGRGERFANYARGGVGIYDEPDIVAMTQYAITHKLADPARLIVAGKSQGGFLSYLSSVRNGAHGFGWRFQGAIACAGVTDWDTMTMTSDIGYTQAGMAGGAPWDLQKSDVRTRAGSAIWEFRDAADEKRIPPMLLIHGDEDKRVPISQAVGFRRALDEVGLPFEFAVYRGEGHYFQKRKSAEDLMERIVRFVRKYLARTAVPEPYV